jgi:hypothetical protein
MSTQNINIDNGTPVVKVYLISTLFKAQIDEEL